MSQKVQRNALCPCGSGQKYKKCCLLKAKDESNKRYDHRDGVQKALVWLNQTSRPQIDQWVEEFWFTDISDSERQGISTADAQIRAIHDVNVLELLLAEGRFSDEESEATPLQLVLNEPSIDLSESQRAYLTQLTQRPLRLYVVVSSNPGQSFTLKDVLHDEVFDVFDPMGSRMFDVDDHVGLRMMNVGDRWETSGAIYHIPRAFEETLTEILSSTKDAQSEALSYFWLKLVAAHV